MDGGIPPKSASAIVTVLVLRNNDPPVFSENEYDVTLLELMNVGEVVLSVDVMVNDQVGIE